MPAQRVGDLGGGILKTIMGLRGLDISAESKFDFTLPRSCKEWPAPHYGPDSPHPQHVKDSRKLQNKRRHGVSIPSRPAKASKPKIVSVRKARPQPSRTHGPMPKRDLPLHLLNLPGEMRNLIYDLLVLRPSPIYPQFRPVHKLGQRKVLRRYPREPKLALVNHQLRHEVLSVFYGANLIVFRRSEGELLQSFNMTVASWLTAWHCGCTPAVSAYLRYVELQFTVYTNDGDFRLSYELIKSAEGHIDVTHNLADTEYCCCLEDEASAEIRTQMVGLTDLVRVATVLSRKRRSKLIAFATRGEKEEEGTFMMPTTACLYCRKNHPTHMSA
ncbi:hypothetical protein LTR08_000010 [Meristemomyces frigidus]|nr:hypothetical protein LTR08_000010 [Meristemomyces frigidus]